MGWPMFLMVDAKEDDEGGDGCCLAIGVTI